LTFTAKKLFTVKESKKMLLFIYNTDFNTGEDILDTTQSMIYT
jgi:hypothetical protein